MPKTTNTTPTSSELIQQSEALRRQAEALKAKEKPQVVSSIKAAIAHYGLTAADLGLIDAKKSAKKTRGKATTSPEEKSPTKKKSAKKRSAKQYRDASGHSWSGFGPRPQWLKDALAAGATEESLLV